MSTQAFGEYLRKLRKAKGLSQRDVEAETTISHKTMYGYEYGITLPQPDVIRKLSLALGVTHIGLMIKAGHVTEEEVLTFRREHGINDGGKL